MQTRMLGTIEVPVIGLGTFATFDVITDDEIKVRRAILDSCVEHGVKFIDTSPMYKQSEEVIGIAMEGKRSDFILATKVWIEGKDAGIAQMAKSFALLKTDYIDVMQIHNQVDWETHITVLEEMKAEGKIGLTGVTHQMPTALPLMAKMMRTGRFDTIQISYNVMEHDVEETILPLAEEMGIGVIVMRPFGNGALLRELKSDPDIGPLKEFGIETWAQALIAYVLADERVSVQIPATSKPERIAENASVGSVNLPQELRSYIRRETERCL